MENIKGLEKFETVANHKLAEIDGGFIPLAARAIWGAAAAAGFGGGIAVGLNYKNRK
ncbi:MAG: class IIb bacteriocin, lactobin A/cerein 7B family [Lactobacillales bacterium]|nr:class IIb bacteriocin, lactobin A/cerein 7B family [Lactobacillales bacterium]